MELDIEDASKLSSEEIQKIIKWGMDDLDGNMADIVFEIQESIDAGSEKDILSNMQHVVTRIKEYRKEGIDDEDMGGKLWDDLSNTKFMYADAYFILCRGRNLDEDLETYKQALIKEGKSEAEADDAKGDLWMEIID